MHSGQEHAHTALGSFADVAIDPQALVLTPSNVTIATGVITIRRSHHKVDTEAAAASDDLDTIKGGEGDMLLILRPVSGARTVVIKHGTGNILTLGGTDITLDDEQDFAILIRDPRNSAGIRWYAR